MNDWPWLEKMPALFFLLLVTKMIDWFIWKNLMLFLGSYWTNKRMTGLVWIACSPGLATECSSPSQPKNITV